MRLLRLLVLAGVVLIAVGACAHGVEPPVATGPPVVQPGGPISTTSAPPAQVTPHGGPAVAAAQLDVSAIPSAAPDVWTEEDGRVVGVLTEQRGCEAISLRVAEQSANRVVVVLVTRDTRQPGRMCPLHVTDVAVGVRLDTPLGQRTLVLQEQTVR